MKSGRRQMWNSLRKGLGLALVLSALAGTAHAVPAAPEIDPGSMGSALTLLACGALMITGKSRKS